jgi:hypothetical protein
MRLFSSVLSLVFFLGLGATASARLGEPVEQLTVRYGGGANGGKDVLIFHKQNWTIIVSLMNGVSAQESYQKPGGATNEDIATLLSLNADGHTWKEKPVNYTMMGWFIRTLQPATKSWIRDDGAYAFVPGGINQSLTIESKEKLDADQAKEAADKKAKQSSLQSF